VSRELLRELGDRHRLGGCRLLGGLAHHGSLSRQGLDQDPDSPSGFGLDLVAKVEAVEAGEVSLAFVPVVD